jgi:hypothetical protein
MATTHCSNNNKDSLQDQQVVSHMRQLLQTRRQEGVAPSPLSTQASHLKQTPSGARSHGQPGPMIAGEILVTIKSDVTPT